MGYGSGSRMVERWPGIPADGLLTMPITLTVPLDLPDVRVLADRMLEDGTVLIEVESSLRTTQCHRCGREIDRGQVLLLLEKRRRDAVGG